MEIIHKNKDVIQIILQGLGLFSLVLVYLQMRINNKWNRLNRTLTDKWHNKFDDYFSKLENLEEENIINIGEELTSEKLSKIKESKFARRTIIDYLNLCEEISGAFFMNALNDKYAFDIYSAPINQAWENFKPFIQWLRQRDKDCSHYSQLEYLALVWKEKSSIRRYLFKKKYMWKIYWDNI